MRQKLIVRIRESGNDQDWYSFRGLRDAHLALDVSQSELHVLGRGWQLQKLGRVVNAEHCLDTQVLKNRLEVAKPLS